MLGWVVALEDVRGSARDWPIPGLAGCLRGFELELGLLLGHLRTIYHLAMAPRRPDRATRPGASRKTAVSSPAAQSPPRRMMLTTGRCHFPDCPGDTEKQHEQYYRQDIH